MGEMEELYGATFNSGIWKFIQWHPTLRQLVWVSFLISLFQWIWPVIVTIRQEELSRDGKALNVIGACGEGYPIVGGSSVHNRAVAMALTESAGLVTMQACAITECEASIKGLIPFFTADKDATLHTLDRAYDLGQRMVGRVLFNFLGENCFQLYVQTAVFVVRNFLAKRAYEDSIYAQRQQLASLLLSVITTMLKFVECIRFFIVVKEVTDLASHHAQCLTDFEQELLQRLRWCIWIVRMGCALMAVTLLVSVGKLVGAFVCEDSIWNVSEIFGASHGCINMESFCRTALCYLLANRHIKG